MLNISTSLYNTNDKYIHACYWQSKEEEKSYEALSKMLKTDSIYNLETAENIYQASGLKAVIDWKIKIDVEHAGQEVREYSIANSYGLIGEEEKALEWLEKAFISGEISPEMSYNIHFRNLHNNPRYIAILKKMGLAEQ